MCFYFKYNLFLIGTELNLNKALIHLLQTLGSEILVQFPLQSAGASRCRITESMAEELHEVSFKCHPGQDQLQ